MNPQTLTWISGVVLLLVFALVALRMCRTGSRHGGGRHGHSGHGAGGCCGPLQTADQHEHEHVHGGAEEK